MEHSIIGTCALATNEAAAMLPADTQPLLNTCTPSEDSILR